MTSIARFTLPAASFPLGAVFDDRPSATFELDRVVPSGDTAMPYFWVTDADLDAVLDALEGIHELRAVTLMERVDGKGLFKAVWKPEYLGIMQAIAESGVTVVSASGSREGWLFELRDENGECISAFQAYCTEHGIDVRLTQLSRLADQSDGAATLTARQREALLLAYERGYYDESDRPDLESLAAELGISRQAYSARLRRGYRNLVETTLVPDRDGIQTA
ncbi:helix-turn-helix domain-containing protein [Haloarcula salina]|uniref:Helix-turn-helix domain-containing protein n=1 Tax=Haloarcula salina TaxID=1429914 RepID=A0AA41G471_9EURY|nr:helix-turn-helix domain-containing protein [Haloarcula salina]MBV0903334.1 helix-turn-helix domain-containing protein [Haloarcula salina]